MEFSTKDKKLIKTIMKNLQNKIRVNIDKGSTKKRLFNI